MFTRNVGRRTRGRKAALRTRNIYDRTCSSFLHFWYDKMRTQVDASQVHSDHPIPLGRRIIDDGAIMRDCGVIDQDVDSTEAVNNRLYSICHDALRGNITMHE